MVWVVFVLSYLTITILNFHLRPVIICHLSPPTDVIASLCKSKNPDGIWIASFFHNYNPFFSCTVLRRYHIIHAKFLHLETYHKIYIYSVWTLKITTELLLIPIRCCKVTKVSSNPTSKCLWSYIPSHSTVQESFVAIKLYRGNTAAGVTLFVYVSYILFWREYFI